MDIWIQLIKKYLIKYKTNYHRIDWHQVLLKNSH